MDSFVTFADSLAARSGYNIDKKVCGAWQI